MEQKALKKAFHTALAIIPDQIDQIQPIRQKYDTAYDRWPPHINLSFPFVDTVHFDQVYEVLQEEFKTFKAFPITFEKISHLKNTVMILDPQTPNHNLHEVFNKILSRYPILNELGKKSEDGFHPHLTLGRFSSNEMPKRLAEFQQEWKPFTYQCKQLHFLMRTGKDTPMEIIKTIKLATE